MNDPKLMQLLQAAIMGTAYRFVRLAGGQVTFDKSELPEEMPFAIAVEGNKITLIANEPKTSRILAAPANALDHLPIVGEHAPLNGKLRA
jgi:hypothetical protein